VTTTVTNDRRWLRFMSLLPRESGTTITAWLHSAQEGSSGMSREGGALLAGDAAVLAC
jgi:hypothetical protein